MTARGQAVLALGAALGLHVGAFALQPGPAGAVSSGAGGTALVSLAAADGTLADIVATWDRPPVLDQPASPQPVLAPQDPAPDLARPAPAQPDLPVLPGLAALPMTEDRPPVAIEAPPPVPPSPEVPLAPEPPSAPSTQRPKARPAKAAEPPKPAASPQPASPPAPKTARRSVEPTLPQAGQVARGAGGGDAAGQSGNAAAGTAEAADGAQEKAAWGAKIRSRIERKKAYPAAAKGAKGTVTVRLSVGPGGQLLSVSLAKSSGVDALDAAALRAVQAAAPFPPAPKGMGGQAQSFTLPMTFKR